VELWVRTAAEQFWARAGQSGPFPRDLERAVNSIPLPLAIIKLPNLWLATIDDWLRRHGIPTISPVTDRALRGCTVAYAGKGMIFLDGSDEPKEFRFTLAHEVAHFLLDYLQNRESLISKFGREIVSVLDGLRPPTPEERIDAVLARRCLAIHTHFLDRDGDGMPDRVAVVETRADRFALELLAPAGETFRFVNARLRRKPYATRVRSVTRALTTRFDLPHSVASGYAAYLCRSWFGGPSVREWLGMS
jgi:hypothetical protein